MKTIQTERTALDGGIPVRQKFLPFALPHIEEAEIQEVVETLRSGWLTTGPRTKRFEQEFAQYVGCKHAVAVSSATAAMHLALDAIGLQGGDEVITTPFTFAATAEVVLYFKARPVFVDITPDTFNIDTDRIEAGITEHTKALLPVHIGGHPCDMDRIAEIARKHGLIVIEDAAHAVPTKYKGRMIGTIGDLTAFSFYATKPIATGEGGMITTDNDEYAEKCRIMSLHGISHDAWERYTTEGSWYYEILYPGYKYNLTDIAAAIGLHQLRKCDRMQQLRQRIAQLYEEGFKGLHEIETPVVNGDVQHAWHLYIIRLRLDMLRCDRAEFFRALKAENIGVSVHFIPLHLHPYYRRHYGYRPEDFPNAKYAYDRIISLPIYPKMSDEDVQDVITAVKKVVAWYRK